MTITTTGKTYLDERLGEDVEYDPLTGMFRKKVPEILEERENPYWTKMGQPRKRWVNLNDK